MPGSADWRGNDALIDARDVDRCSMPDAAAGPALDEQRLQDALGRFGVVRSHLQDGVALSAGWRAIAAVAWRPSLARRAAIVGGGARRPCSSS
jgi:hypothetical protein